MKKSSIKFLFLGSVLSACTSVSTLQTAKTLGSGQNEQTFGGGIYQSKTKSGDVELESNIPYLEYTFRHGFYENLDAGLKVAFVGGYSADFKYQFYKDDRLNISTGFGLSYLEYKIKSGDVETEVKSVDALAPLYISYDLNSSWVLYTSPKYILRSSIGDIKGSEGLFGVTGGVKIGEKNGVYAEATLLKGRTSETTAQYNVSFFW